MMRGLGRKGAVAALSAVVMVPVLGFAGLAIDLTRIWMVNARLKTAVDAAALVAARQISLNAAERDAQVTAVYWANFTQNGRTPNYLGATLHNPQIVSIAGDANRIRVNGRADVPTTLFGLIAQQTTPVQDSAIAERLASGIELALVIDQTRSMGEAAAGFTSKLAAAQAAARTMLGILYGSNDVQHNVFVSVVPFARTINVGSHNTAFLDTANMRAGWDPARWYGCVEARLNGNNDIRDLGPGDAGGRLRPYFYQSTFRRVGWVDDRLSNQIVNLSVNATAWRNATGTEPYSGAEACRDRDAYPAITIHLRERANSSTTRAYQVRFCHGDNDSTNPSLASAGNDEFDYLVGRGLQRIGDTPEHAAGPNRLCAQTPILPLTASRATVQARINAIVTPRESGGTTIVTGMQGAWYTLSPRWQGHWPGISSSPQYGTLPLAYNTGSMVKAVVLL